MTQVFWYLQRWGLKKKKHDNNDLLLGLHNIFQGRDSAVGWFGDFASSYLGTKESHIDSEYQSVADNITHFCDFAVPIK